MNLEQARALLMVGQFAAMAGKWTEFDLHALEDYLAKPDPSFDFEQLCRLTIDFIRAVEKLNLPDAYTIS